MKITGIAYIAGVTIHHTGNEATSVELINLAIFHENKPQDEKAAELLKHLSVTKVEIQNQNLHSTVYER